jgi:tyrosine decarboxylase/aspartate 1-decarboxylase
MASWWYVIFRHDLDTVPRPDSRLARGSVGPSGPEFAELPHFDLSHSIKADEEGCHGAVLEEVAVRMGDNYPYFHPLYAGQMLKPPHPIARAAYTLAMAINPNNHARDGGRASSQMEIEAVAEIAKCSAGRRASRSSHLRRHLRQPRSALDRRPTRTWQAHLAQEQAHYTHKRITSVLQLPFSEVASDNLGRMD